jgi:outer membrane lipoprotein-sorting protein
MTVVTLLLFFSASSFAKDLSAGDIVQKSADTDKVSTWSAKVTMRLIPKNGSERVRESVISNKLQPNGTDMQRMVHFISPADINGTNILIHEHSADHDDIWIYLPSMKKVRRLLSSNQKDSFMGTDFTYTDITTTKVSDYVHTLLRREDVDGTACHVIESVPKTDDTRRDTGYSKSVSWIRADTYVRVKAELYDLSGALFKIMKLHSAREIDEQRGKWLMEKVEMKNLQSGHSTVILFQDIRTGAGINDRLFAPNQLDKEYRP